MPVCVFKDCFSGSKKKTVVTMDNVHLHRFPKDRNLRFSWLQQIKHGQTIDINSINLENGNTYISRYLNNFSPKIFYLC